MIPCDHSVLNRENIMDEMTVFLLLVIVKRISERIVYLCVFEDHHAHFIFGDLLTNDLGK